MPNRYIGRKFMAELDEFQPGSSLHLYDKLKSMPIELPYIRKNVREFIQLIDPLIADAETLQPAELIQILAPVARLRCRNWACRQAQLAALSGITVYLGGRIAATLGSIGYNLPVRLMMKDQFRLG